MLNYLFSLMASVLHIPFSSSDHNHVHDHDHDSNPESSPPHPPPSPPARSFNDVKGKGPMDEKEMINISLSHPSTSYSLTFSRQLPHFPKQAQAQPKVESSGSLASIPSSSSWPELSTKLQSSKHQHQNCKSANNISPSHEISTSQAQEPLPANQTPLVIQTISKQDLGRHILVLAVPMAVGLFVIHKQVRAPLITGIIAVALLLGFVLIWNALLLYPIRPETSNLIEPIGISFILLAFFGIIACFLPENLIWIPIICWVLCHVPFVLSFSCRGRPKRSTSDDNNPTTLRLPV